MSFDLQKEDPIATINSSVTFSIENERLIIWQKNKKLFKFFPFKLITFISCQN